MADKKISELTSMTDWQVDDANDTLAIVATSAGQTKKITREELLLGVTAERGSNANGEYVKFPDGTQICTFSLTSSTSGAVTWTYPASFLTVPRTSLDVITGAVRLASGVNRGNSSIDINVYDLSGTRQAQVVDCIAIGRWS